MPRYTTVQNLATNQQRTYDLPPEKAVVFAFEQIECKNYASWTYPEPHMHPRFVDGEKSVACGDWCALKH